MIDVFGTWNGVSNNNNRVATKKMDCGSLEFSMLLISLVLLTL